MEFQTNDRVAITLEDDGVAQVRFIRADKMNALDQTMFETMIAAGEALQAEKGVRAVVLSGEGRAFCAGLDLSNFGNPDGSGNHPLATRTHGDSNRAQQVATQWRKLKVPVIAAVHGVCFGGGLQIASGADIRIVHPETRMAIMEMKWGLVPDMGGYPLWRGLVRDDLLRELIYTNREFTGAEAQALGLATHVDEDPHARATDLARVMADRNPHAMQAAKRIANKMYDATAADLLIEESVEQDAIIRSPNQVEAVMAGMAKRKAAYAEVE
ncbi:crotonase/enoyl-CoA hydratase family protein [Parerythrobacter aestuarii]|uniref:crotonase/enoyl-CoA hydratase family protein n=1 Tax=Parerythrobacter aestuarii TaxID=3020909 RepID=UPI0024DEE18A|nr:crotonase/enoyl-CoA hydratase family protein [Parerythrobacter aestuarii]